MMRKHLHRILFFLCKRRTRPQQGTRTARIKKEPPEAEASP